MKQKSDIFHSKNYLFLNSIILLGYIFLYPILTNKIEPEIYGHYILIHSVAIIIVSISNLGLKIGYKRNYFEFYENKKNTEIFLFSVQIFIFIIFSVIFILNLIFYDEIINLFNGIQDIQNLWLFLLLALMFDSISKFYLIYLENKRQSEKYFFLVFFRSLSYFSLLFYFLLNNYGVISLVYSLLISNFIILGFIIILQFKNTHFVFNKKFVKDALKISIPNTPRSLFGQINAKADKILISALSSFSNTGIYTIAQSLSYVVFQITTSLDKVFITRTNQMLFKKENTKIGPYLSPFIYICSLPAIAMFLFHDLILKIFIDEKYYGSENVIIILTLYYFTLTFGKIASTQLIYAKKVWLNSNFFIMNIILNIILNIPLIYFFEIIGAAIATLASSSISLMFSMKYAKKNAYISLEKKLIYLCFSFIFISSFYSILITNKIINIYYLYDQILSLLIIITYLVLGFKYNLYNINTLKNIFSFTQYKK